MWVGIGVGIGRNRFATGIFNAYALRVTADGGITEAGQCVDAVSSLLQSASLLLIPSGYKGGTLYSEIPTNGNGDLTWTRGGDAFRTNASGVLQRVPWNLLSYSDAFDNANWLKLDVTITANSTTAPNGTLTADLLIPSTINTNHIIYQSPPSVNANQSYTFSYYAKSQLYTKTAIRIGGSGYATVPRAEINLQTGAIIYQQGFTTLSVVASGDGWYRISGTIVASSFLIANIQPLSDSYSVVAENYVFAGNGTSGIYIWGAQLVEGTTAQTYLPTTDRLNFPRLSYMYGSCPSALLEPQRTNLVLQSQDFDNASWTKGNASVTANNTTAPDGSSNADKLVENSLLGQHYVQQILTVTSGAVYTWSAYVKASERTRINMLMAQSTTPFTNHANITFDLSNGTISSTTAGTGSIVNVGNGWYRVIVTGTTSSTGEIARISLALTDNSDTYLGNGTSGAFIFGAQFEQGAYVTTPIPTTSATATRVADSFSRNNIYTNGLISASGGTWFVELRGNISYVRDAASYGVFIGDSTTPNSGNQFIIRNAGGLARLSVVNYVASTLTSVYTTNADIVKLAIKWNGSTADIFANGTKVVTATSFTPTNMENLIGNGGSVPIFIQQMALYPTPLSDTDCTTITTL